MGRFIVATGVNPDTSHVKVDILDPVFPTAGALVLLDPTHPTGAWASGVPTSGAALPNVALSQCRAAFPSLTDANCQPALTIGSTFAAHGLAERTAKGGLHLARSAVAGDANTYAALQMPSTFSQSANGVYGVKGHSFFVSLWGRVTKAYDPAYSGGVPVHSVLSVDNAGYGFYSRRTTGSTNFPTTNLGSRAAGVTGTDTVLGPLIQNIAVSNMSTLTNAQILQILTVGNQAGFVVSGNYGKTPSFVLYRFYLEDLTVSGRSYATVDALDYAQYTKDVLTSGGRYYGDSYTDPTTLVA